MAILTLEPTVLSNVEGPFDAIWQLVGEESSLLNFGTNGQNQPILPGEELISDGTSQSIANPAWEFKADESLIIRHDKPIKYIKEFCEIADKIGGDTDFLYFIKSYRCSIDNRHWGKWCSFDKLPQNWNYLDDFYVEFKYICLEKPDADTEALEPDDGWTLLLFFVKINGILEQERTNQKVELTEPGQCMVLSPDDIWKVFELTDFVLIAGGLTEDRGLRMSFRASSTAGPNRLWTEWQPLTTGNLQAAKIDPLRFWYLEVQFCRTGTDPTGEIKIYDVELIGDFQNVTDNYSKLGKMGFRSDCLNIYADPDSCAVSYPPDEFKKYEECDVRFQDNKWNPYDLKATELYKKLTEDVNQLFGWKTVYYKTDPDQKGRDVILHEYSLSHVIAESEVKVMVDKNQFPDNKVFFTPFDLEMFDSWTVHITRDEFKRAFGIEERPRKWDLLFMCETNRLYQVDHAQAHKDFLNTSVYYEVTLRKAQDNLNVKPTPEIQQSIDELTENNSLDALFGEETKQEIENVSDKEQLQVLTKDEVRKEINDYTRIVNDPILNGPNVISKDYYDFANVSVENNAIVYNSVDTNIKEGENRAFVFWFNLKTKTPGQPYNFITNQAVINNQPYGYRFTYQDNRIDVDWNDQFFEWMVPELQTNHWYALVIQMNQNLAKWTYSIYRRKSDINPRSYNDPALTLVKLDSGELTPVTWDIPNNTVIHGSEMKMTNIRVFKELINMNDVQMVLSQYIIRESGKLIFADNATPQLYLPTVNYRAKEARNI